MLIMLETVQSEVIAQMLNVCSFQGASLFSNLLFSQIKSINKRLLSCWNFIERCSVQAKSLERENKKILKIE